MTGLNDADREKIGEARTMTGLNDADREKIGIEG